MRDGERDQLVGELTAIHEQMLERDRALMDCQDELRDCRRDLSETQRELAAAGAHIEDLTHQIGQMRATRTWRLAEAIWSARSRLSGVRRR